ncbi:MAG: hypothetical protein M3O50_05300 [Myxococcota bacterium]|nr:hypothetical protein [Myxococcota bacterium]
MHPYGGNPASYPDTVDLIDDSDVPNAANIGTADEGALDRTAYLKLHKLTKDAADTITGPIEVSGAGSLTIVTTETVAHGALLEVKGTLQFDAGSNIAGTTDRADLTIDGGTTHLAGGQVSCDAPNSIQGHAAGAIVPTVAGGITDGGLAGGIQTTTPGGLKLGGGPNDFVGFTAVRTKVVSFPPRPLDPSALDTVNWNSLGAPGTAGGALNAFALQGHHTTTGIFLELPCPHQGAILASVSVALCVVTVRSAVPLNLPWISVQRFRITPGSPPPNPEALNSTDPHYFTPAPADGASWHDGANTKLLTYNTNINNVIDNVNYTYVIAVTDENGAGSAAGNLYMSVTATYTNIPDTRFPF